MQLVYFGHSAFMIKTAEFEILIDPFLKFNPLFEKSIYDGLKPDYILVTHGHSDHLGDTLELATRKNATVIAPSELASFLSKNGAKTHGMYIGGAFEFPFGKVKMTIAVHGSSFTSQKDSSITYTGNPCGYLLTIEGKTLYHAGDTGLFYDMKLLGEMNKIDLAMLPIGDNYTMGTDDATKAIEFLNPNKIVPMHYNTFDVIKVENDKLEKFAENKNVIIMKPNSIIEI